MRGVDRGDESGREDAPPAFEAALEAGLRRLPDDRYGSAREFGEALQAVELEMGLPVTALWGKMRM